MISEDFRDNHNAARLLHKGTPLVGYTVGGYAKDHERAFDVSASRHGYDQACSRITLLRTALVKAYLRSKVRFRKRRRVR